MSTTPSSAATTKRIEMFAARFLAETPEGHTHPNPDDEVMEQRFAGCVKPPKRSLYPVIRAEILRTLASRAQEFPPTTCTTR